MLSSCHQINSKKATEIYFTIRGAREEMGSASKASLLIAASVGAVEALKDQVGLCRWNYAIRSLNQRAKNSNMGSFSQAKRMSSAVDRRKGVDEQAKKAEESLRTVMYLSCWGPN
ncbi:uncharacterized protein [Typha angustifolia]|uniref:uncharacterized protein n=1 Tax=Typha angustifolia TaxID=59011 RepID=UPI003C2E5C06